MSMADFDSKPQRDALRTQAAILASAQDAFSLHGYAGASVRDITAGAGVNPALVSRYFGSKEKLFEAALADLLEASPVTGAPREAFGEAMVAMLTARPRVRRNPLQMMLLASADAAARAITTRLLTQAVIEPLAQWFGAEDGAARAARFCMLASGLTLYSEVYPLDAFTGELDPATRRWLVAAFQSLLD